MLGPRDRRNLEHVHPDLRRVVERAAKDGLVPFLVGNPAARQDAPRYASGHAVDLYPLLGKPVTALSRSDFLHLVAVVRLAARQEGVAMVHGADQGNATPACQALDPAAYPA